MSYPEEEDVNLTTLLFRDTGTARAQPANDNCASAQSILINDASPKVGTTVGATTELRLDDVVYSFVGEGRTVRISTCFDQTQVAHSFVLRDGGCVYATFGESSSDAECPQIPNAASYEFDTEDGVTYPLIVYTRQEGVQGQFAIQVTDYVNPINDYCAKALSLSINGAPVTGSTVNATWEARSDDVVYSFVGNGHTVRISTCFGNTTVPHNFVLRDGGCVYATFGESSSDTNCSQNPNAAAYEFDTTAGKTYPIIVYPRIAGEEGQFRIWVAEPGQPKPPPPSQAPGVALTRAPVPPPTPPPSPLPTPPQTPAPTPTLSLPPAPDLPVPDPTSSPSSSPMASPTQVPTSATVANPTQAPTFAPSCGQVTSESPPLYLLQGTFIVGCVGAVLLLLVSS
jgi:hypothetical protein